MSDGQKAFFEGLVLLFLVALVLPALISAKSTTLVVLGIGIIVGIIAVGLGVVPYKSSIVKLIEKDML